MGNTDRTNKIFPAFITKVDADQGIVEAIVNTFGIVDDGDDLVPNGAFTKTLTESGRKVRVLNSHASWDVMNVLGIPLEIREVGRDELPDEVLQKYPEATGGLFTKTQYLLDTPEGLGAFNRIKARAVDEFSIGYQAMEVEYRKMDWRGQERNVRILKQIRLWEYSPVVWGMNPATAVVGAKDATGQQGKEMTADGPMMRYGDYFEGRMRMVANNVANEMLAYGRLSTEEHKAINTALDAGMQAFIAALPESLRLTVMNSRGFYYHSAEEEAEGKKPSMPILPVENKTPENEDKAGRVLSESNATRIRATVDLLKSATENLENVLVSAGVIDSDNESSDENSTDDDGKAAPLAGPDAGNSPAAPPTDEARKRLLAEIDGELDDIAILEAQ